MVKVSRKLESYPVSYVVLPGLKKQLSQADFEKLKAVSVAHVFNSVATVVCEVTGVPKSALSRKFSNEDVILTRQLCMYYLFIYCNLKLSQIAYLLRPESPFHHSTIIHGRELIKDCLKANKTDDFSLKVKGLCEQINSKLLNIVHEHNSTNG